MQANGEAPAVAYRSTLPVSPNIALWSLQGGERRSTSRSSTGKCVMEYNAAMCTHCLLLYILCTTDVITLWGLPSLFPNSKHLLYGWFFPQSVKVKKMVGIETLGISCSFLCYRVPGGQTYLVWRGAGCTEESKIVPSFPTQKNTKMHAHTYTCTYNYFLTMFIYRFL